MWSAWESWQVSADGRRVVGIEATVRSGILTVSVSDAGNWTGDSARSQLSGRGRGFMIVNAIADRVVVHTSAMGTTVTFERRARWRRGALVERRGLITRAARTGR